MKKYKFLVGYFEPRTSCTVKASDEEQAFENVRYEMDKRYEKADKEPPVAWDLELVEIIKH